MRARVEENERKERESRREREGERLRGRGRERLRGREIATLSLFEKGGRQQKRKKGKKEWKDEN